MLSGYSIGTRKEVVPEEELGVYRFSCRFEVAKAGVTRLT